MIKLLFCLPQVWARLDPISRTWTSTVDWIATTLCSLTPFIRTSEASVTTETAATSISSPTAAKINPGRPQPAPSSAFHSISEVRTPTLLNVSRVYIIFPRLFLSLCFWVVYLSNLHLWSTGQEISWIIRLITQWAYTVSPHYIQYLVPKIFKITKGNRIIRTFYVIPKIYNFLS